MLTWRSPNLATPALGIQVGAPVGVVDNTNRDVKGVHGDVTALLSAGVLGRAEGGGIVFPYEAVKVEFLLHAA